MGWHNVDVAWSPQGYGTLHTDFKVWTGDLPTRIEVTRQPNKTVYNDGETINPSGIIVHGYYGDGGDYGTILNSELTFDPMTADISKMSGNSYTSELDIGENSKPIRAYNSIHTENVWQSNSAGYCDFDITGNNDERFVIINSNGRKCVWAFSSQVPSVTVMRYSRKTGETINYGTHQYYSGNSYETYTYGGKTVYGKAVNYEGEGDGAFDAYDILEGSTSVWGQITKNIAWTVVYGEMISGGQPITVKWNRPADGETLTTTFNITVNDTTENS